MSTCGLLLVGLLLFIGARFGESLKCYSYVCSNTTGPVPGGSPKCASPVAVTCGKVQGLGVDADRCSTQRYKSKMSGFDVYQEIRNCSHTAMCTSAIRDMICKQANTTGMMESCDIGCCQGDLCNSGGAMPTYPPTGPSGSDLNCYSCSSMPIAIPGLSTAQAQCTKPVRQNCGGDGLVPGFKQDQCMSIRVTMAGIPYEMRNCSSQMYCNKQLICKNMNTTGMLSRCDLECCVGNLCNGDVKPTSGTVTLPSGTGTVPSVNGTVPSVAATLSNASIGILFMLVLVKVL